jgi:hypothetical protein
MFPVRYGKTYTSYLRWILSRIVTVILIYHRHKPIDSFLVNVFNTMYIFKLNIVNMTCV